MFVALSRSRLQLTQRQAAFALFAFLITFTVIIGGIGILQNNLLAIASCGASLPIHILLLTLYRRGWTPAPYVVVVFVSLLMGFLVDGAILVLWPLVPVALALVFTDAMWTAGIGVSVLLLILARSGWGGAYVGVDVLSPYLFLIVCAVASRLIVQTALRNTTAQARLAEQARREALEALGLAEARAGELRIQAATQAELLSTLQQQRDELQQQREMIRGLSVPVLPLDSGTLVMPLVGVLDGARLQMLQEQALGSIQAHRARSLLLDVTGVPTIDHEVARGLLGVAQSARLLGAQVALVGVRPEVAQTIISLGLQLDVLRSFASLDDGVRVLAQRC